MTNDEQLKASAKYIAMVVRNEVEDFHCAYLTDDQMRELNPIIRNAIYTALFNVSQAALGVTALKAFVDFHMRTIPRYWEEPKLLYY